MDLDAEKHCQIDIYLIPSLVKTMSKMMKMQNGQEKKWVNGYDSHLPSIYFTGARPNKNEIISNTESIGLRHILGVPHLV